ncbi:MAG: hypothetical protein EBU88_11665, partial [Acidobacteria bacterium]|nr:hypothetical protein [Acidobacteriota bacterium]
DSNDEKSEEVRRFKENTDLTQLISGEIFENAQKKSKKRKRARVYRVILIDSGDDDGNFLELSKEISVFEYADILSNIFELEVDINYSSDIEKDIVANEMTFESIDDLLEFLSSREDDDFDDE